MYEPFPGNYVWNLSINLCLAMGGAMGEMDCANDEVREIAAHGEDEGVRHGDVDAASEHARERGARGPRADVGQLAQGVQLEIGVLGAQRTWSFQLSDRQEDVGDRVAIDDQGDLAVREDGGARQRPQAPRPGPQGAPQHGGGAHLDEQDRRGIETVRRWPLGRGGGIPP